MATQPPIRVALDAGPLYGHRTGVGVAVEGMMRSLRGRADVTVVPYLTSFRSRPDPDHRRLPLPGIVASHLWSRADRPTADRWLGDVDVVHGTNYWAPPSSRPTVVSVYDCWFLRHPDDAIPVVRRAGRMLRRAVARGAWIHASSDATADEVRSLLATDRVTTVHPGAPEPPAQVEATPAGLAGIAGRRFVVAIGTEERRKDVPLLVSAFDRLAGGHPDVELVLAGAGGDDTDRITSAISAAGSTTRDRIHRLGTIDETTKAWLLRHAAALAYPSLDEGFGFPILEAQLAGTPVVATSVGSIPEVAGDAAVLVTDRDPLTLAEAIATTLDGPDRLGLIEAGYRNAARFRWSTAVEQLVELYRTAMR